ncbi:MAG TPA: Maf family protein, partial [Bacilli bacterium]|nr:Maf family protein [Bacilli bacterium]
IVDESTVAEVVKEYQNPQDYVMQMAILKWEDVFSRHPKDLVICADTIVCLDELILGKPHNPLEAQAMLQTLSGRTHNVLTGVYLRLGAKKKVFVVKTEVSIDKLSEEEINQYIMMGEAYDKAGAYAIQGFFGKYVKKIRGDYYNVMGLPLNRLYRELQKFNQKTS